MNEIIFSQDVVDIIKRNKFAYQTAGGESYCVSVPILMQELAKCKCAKERNRSIGEFE